MHSCDGCTVCCKLLKIPELEKPGGVWCTHCKIGTGCTAYETRPEPCRVYECLWLKTQQMDKPIPFQLRPDKSRVLIGTTNGGEEIVLYVDKDRPDAWRRGEFGQLVADWKRRGVRIMVSNGDQVERI